MSDGFVTDNLAFACALLYIFSEDVLTRIERNVPRGQTFHLDAPSLDCQSFADDFKNGQLAISDLKIYMRIYDFMVRKLKAMQKNGDMSWCSLAWQRGVTSTGRTIR